MFLVYSPLLKDDELLVQNFIRPYFKDFKDVGLLAFDVPIAKTLGVFKRGQLLGILQCTVVDNEAEIVLIAVSHKHRRLSIGKNLIDLFLKFYPSVHKIILDVAITNAKAVGFYKNLGFEEVGLRKNYYEQTNTSEKIDAILMTKSLTYEKNIIKI